MGGRKKRIVIFGCGSAGQRAYAERASSTEVIGFADNAAALHGTRCCDLPVFAPNALPTLDFDAVVIASMYYREIWAQLTGPVGLPASRVILAAEFAANEGGAGGRWAHALRRRGWPADADDFRLWQLKNKHRGRRAFILGNGPSMQLRFLDRLDGEVTFAMNQMFRCFERTPWRPTYYALSDTHVVRNYGATIQRMFPGPMLVSGHVRELLGREDRIVYVRKTHEHYEHEEPRFSPNPLWNVEGGYTTAYFCLQLGWFMGIRDFVTLGVDASYKFSSEHERGRDGAFETVSNAPEENWFLPGYFERDTVLLKPRVPQQMLAYQAARRYIEAHGGRIRNAGAGSPLETFPKISFDALFD